MPTTLEGGPFLLGARLELDVWRIALHLSVDQSGATPFTLDAGQRWTALVGYGLVANRWARLRLLGGASATSSTDVSPTVGANLRLSWAFLGADAAAVLTPFTSSPQLDVRAAGILRGGPFELHVGYRARWLDLGAAPLAGPHVALGLAL